MSDRTERKTKIIVISNLKFINHRSLNKLKYSKINLLYSTHIFHKVVTNICSDKNINISLKEKSGLIIKSNYNLNTFISLITTNRIIETQSLDDFSSERILLEKLFTEDYHAKDVIRLFEPSRIKISLDLLENLFNYFIDLKSICKIYNNYVQSDILDTLCINYLNMGEYSCSLTIYNIYYLLKKNKCTYTTMINNKYISRSLINTHSRKLNYEYNSSYKEFIFIYLFMIKSNNYDLIINKVLSIDKKELEFYIKSFNHFYNDKIKIEKIYKLTNK